MKKILTLLTLCALPFFAIAQETTQASSSTETAVQTAQATDGSTVNTDTAVDKEIPTSHLIGCILAYIVIFYIGKKLYILKIFQIICKLPWSGEATEPLIAVIAGFIFYCMAVYYITLILCYKIFG